MSAINYISIAAPILVALIILVLTLIDNKRNKPWHKYLPKKENEVEIKIKKSTLLAIIILIIVAIIAFTEVRFECPICKQTKWSIPHKIECLGIEYKVCGKCYDTMKHIFGDVNNTTKELQNLLK